TVSGYTTGLVRDVGIEPADVFPAFMDLDPFLGEPRPLPERPSALFVGVLELYKNVDGLAEAWRIAAPRVPEARLRIVGRGSRAEVVERLVAELPEQATWTASQPTDAVAAAMDEATVLVLPSRSEGMGRVVVEALLRGRPVVGTRVGGIRDLVRDGENGLLVEPGDAHALAEALSGVLSNAGLAQRLAASARHSAEASHAWAAENDKPLEQLVSQVAADRLG